MRETALTREINVTNDCREKFGGLVANARGEKGEALHKPDSPPGQFEFRGYALDEPSGKAFFHYGYDNGLCFTEEIGFGQPFPAPDSVLRKPLEAALRGLSVALGVSYFKAFLPRRLALTAFELSASQNAFFEKMYRHGLGELAFRNGIDISERRFFPQGGGPDEPVRGAGGALARRSAVLIGGGKDSVVSTEILRAGGEPLVLLAVNPKGPITACMEASGLPSITVKRRLDPLLFRLNEAGALNGHVPITGILSFIALAGAFVHGYDRIILSNERSANEGNVSVGAAQVNHQYSKTIFFEKDFRSYLAGAVPGWVDYFSLLRPLSELRIASLLAGTSRYDRAFSSCNRSFRINGAPMEARWCLDCPKCRFTFLALATAMDKQRLTAIFGGDMLDDPSQLEGFRELTGLSGHKPWECVGEIAESAVSILRLSRDPAWKDDFIVSQLAAPLAARLPNPDEVWSALMAPAGERFLPESVERMLNACLG
jgi:hypothetical protein